MSSPRSGCLGCISTPRRSDRRKGARPHRAAIPPRPRRRGHRVRRRDLLLATAGVILAPRTVLAQSPAVPLIGFLHGSAPVGQYKSYIERFLVGLREEGFEPGRNVAVE